MFLITHKNTIISIILIILVFIPLVFLLTSDVTIKIIGYDPLGIDFGNNVKKNDEELRQMLSGLVTPANYKQYNDSAYICNAEVCCRDGLCFHLNGIVNDTTQPAFYNL